MIGQPHTPVGHLRRLDAARVISGNLGQSRAICGAWMPLGVAAHHALNHSACCLSGHFSRMDWCQ